MDRGAWRVTAQGSQREGHNWAETHLLQDPVSRSFWEGGKPCNLMSPAWWVSLHAFTVTCEFLYSWSSFSADLINTLIFQGVLLKKKYICASQIHIYVHIYASLVAQRLKHLPPMRETRVRSLGWEDPLEKEMATHSSILAWRIPWTEEPGGL